MIPLTAQTRILVATQPADFRKGIDGFVALCREALQHNPRSGALFVFINRRRTMVRILAYEGNGYWLMTKRLSKGTFPGWPDTREAASAVLATQLRQLIRGAPARGTPARGTPARGTSRLHQPPADVLCAPFTRQA